MNLRPLRRVRIAVSLVCFSLTVLCVLTGNEWPMVFQPGPVFVKLTAGFTVSGFMSAVFFLGTTFLFGRYFCAALCPLGVVQDAVGVLREKGRANANIPNLKVLRYGVAAFSYLLLAGGWAIGGRLFDPFSRFGGIVSGLLSMTAGLLPLVVLILLVIWKKRVFCVSVCPVGTLLGLFAKWGVYRLSMNDACTGCGLCEKNCPTGCIDSSKRVIDNEICVRCMNCLCPRGGIEFSRGQTAPISQSRRRFIIKSGAAALGIFAAGSSLGKPILAIAGASGNYDGLVFPPGAIDRKRFARTCTSCQVCALNCPEDIIKPSENFLGFFEPVHLDYTHSGCRDDCARCSAVCPSGALQRVSPDDKKWLRIGESSVDALKCRVVKENTACDLCARVCPKEAIYMTDGPAGCLAPIPEVNAYHCIGCGACQAVCPMLPKAIAVGGIEQEMMWVNKARLP